MEITGKIKATVRKNINRGYKELSVWQDAIALYALTSEIFSKFPYILNKIAANIIDAAHSIPRNIAEGYCRRSLKEYLQFLNVALSSCGELSSGYEGCAKAQQISGEEYERLDQLHYKTENKLIKLVESLQKKQKKGTWESNFALK